MAVCATGNSCLDHILDCIISFTFMTLFVVVISSGGGGKVLSCHTLIENDSSIFTFTQVKVTQ